MGFHQPIFQAYLQTSRHLKFHESLNLWLNISYLLSLIYISDIQNLKIVRRASVESIKNLNFVIFSEIKISPHVFVLSWIEVRLFWIIWNYEDVSGVFFGFYGNCYLQKAGLVNLSRSVWIIFGLNFKKFFWQYMLSLYLLRQIPLSNILPKEPSMLQWNQPKVDIL